MKKLSHSFAKVSHSYKKGVALVGMRHLKTAFINILYFCSYCFFNHALLAFLACVGFKDNRDNRDNLQFCPSWWDFYIIDYSVLVCFFTSLRMQVYKLRPLSVFPHISYAQLGGVAFTASIFVCITRSNLNLTTGTNALCVYIAHSYHWFVVFFHNKAPCAEGAILNFEF